MTTNEVKLLPTLFPPFFLSYVLKNIITLFRETCVCHYTQVGTSSLTPPCGSQGIEYKSLGLAANVFTYCAILLTSLFLKWDLMYLRLASKLPYSHRWLCAICLFFETASLQRPSCPRTHRDPTASGVLGLKVYITRPSIDLVFLVCLPPSKCLDYGSHTHLDPRFHLCMLGRGSANWAVSAAQSTSWCLLISVTFCISYSYS